MSCCLLILISKFTFAKLALFVIVQLNVFIIMMYDLHVQRESPTGAGSSPCNICLAVLLEEIGNSRT